MYLFWSHNFEALDASTDAVAPLWAQLQLILSAALQVGKSDAWSLSVLLLILDRQIKQFFLGLG